MTEEEAKMKGCPFRRVSEENGGSWTLLAETKQVEVVDSHAYNGKKNVWQATGEVHPLSRCWGSKCMAWTGSNCAMLFK